jgi:hypothetical protein
MANSWSKEDRIHYEKSEVWQELEKRIIDTVHRVGILQQKINENAVINKEAEQFEGTPEEKGRALAACQTAGGCKDNADDHVSDEVAEDALEGDALEGDALEGDAFEEDALHDEVIDDLRVLAQSAIEEGNIRLAYKIERTIDEILEQEVACE